MFKLCFRLVSIFLPFLVSAKQINTIVDLAHGFSFYGDGRFCSQYMPEGRWARNMASFRALDLPNANANALLLFEPYGRTPFTAEDCAIVKAFAESGGLVVAVVSSGKSGFGELLGGFGVSAAEAPAGKAAPVPAAALKALAGEGVSLKFKGRPGSFRVDDPSRATVYVAHRNGDPAVLAVKAGKGFLLILPRGFVSEDPGYRDRDYNAEWIRPVLNAHVVREVALKSRPRGREYDNQDFRETLENGLSFYWSAYLDPCHDAMMEIVLQAAPLIEKRMGVPLAGKNASKIALISCGSGGFSSGQLVALAVFWDGFPEKKQGMYEFLTHEMVHSWVLPFGEIWNEPIATYVGDLVMGDAGYTEESARRIARNIQRAVKIDPTMKRYDLSGEAASPGVPELTKKQKTEMHWGKSFWIWEELRKENPSVLADYFRAKRLYAARGKIERYGVNETVAVMSYAMKRDMFGWFAERGVKADRAASEIAYVKEEK